MENEIINEAKEKMNRSIEAVEKKFASVRAGRANPSS